MDILVTSIFYQRITESIYFKPGAQMQLRKIYCLFTPDYFLILKGMFLHSRFRKFFSRPFPHVFSVGVKYFCRT